MSVSIKPQHSTALYGESGIGKSSILKYLQTPEVWQARGLDISQVILVYLDCRLGEPFTPNLFWREILTLLRDKAEEDNQLRDETDGVLSKEQISNRNFGRVLKRIGERGKFLALLLDDFDVTLEPHEAYSEAQMRSFLDGFRNLAAHNPDGPLLSVSVTTFKRLNEIGPRLKPGQGSPWYNHYPLSTDSPL